MAIVSYSRSCVIAGVSFNRSVNRQADSAAAASPELPVGKAGTLTARTDNNTGEATLGSGHGITTGQIVDVYWQGGRRYGLTVGTVAALIVPLDGGTGDDLPTTSTPLVVTPHVLINFNVDGDVAELVALLLETTDPSLTSKGHVSFFDASDNEIAAIDLTTNDPRIYDIQGGDTNLFAGAPITYALASNGSATVAATLNMGVLQDSTP